MSILAKDVIPAPETWRVSEKEQSQPSEMDNSSVGAEPVIRVSPDFQIPNGRVYLFELDVDVEGPASLTFGVRDSRTNEWIRYATTRGAGKQSISVPFSLERKHDVHFALELNSYDAGEAVSVDNVTLKHLEQKEATKAVFDRTDTNIPHWGFLKKWLHKRCKSSRAFNTFIAHLEMRLGREEVVSVPQFMAFCPTGQCNALCDFCSVTINRTGIIKRQLPFDRLHAMFAPVVKAVRMFGLEGNGEPTLYSQFDDLVEELTSHGATIYLITNGSRLRHDQIPKILGFDAVNLSLNAATPEAHRRIMKLKNYDHIIEVMKALVAAKHNKEVWNGKPAISASFVVTNGSIDQVQQFMSLVEREIGVNVAYIRPLSEVATELGAVEDFRDLVPYESDVQDVFDAVEDYMTLSTTGETDFRIDPAAFRSVRPDPPDRVVMPLGFEDRLLAPRRQYWHVEDPALAVEWTLTTAKLSYEGTSEGIIWRSDQTPVTPGTSIHFTGTLELARGPVGLLIRDAQDQLVVEKIMQPHDGKQTFDLPIEVGEREALSLALVGQGQPFSAEFDFDRLRTPGRGIRKEFKLPHKGRWERQMPEAVIDWLNDTTVRIQWNDRPGPYLLKSYSVQTIANEEINLSVTVDVKSGMLVIGVLNEDFSKWHKQFRFEEGRTDATLSFNAGENRRVQFVLFSKAESPLDVTVDWQDALEGAPARALTVQTQDKVKQSSATSETKPQNTTTEVATKKDETADQKKAPAPLEVSSETAAPQVTQNEKKNKQSVGLIRSFFQVFLGPSVERPGFFHHLVWGKNRFYCQKPWTDLANFSVDGRMDVCCIATGPSQEKYSYGNLLFQSFQEVWNGKMAKEFRRTVNSNEPLPPCERCPMSHAYQGPLFDPSSTLFLAYRTIYSFPKKKPIWSWPGGYFIAKAIYWPVHLFLHLTVLRGIRRKWLWKQVTLR